MPRTALTDAIERAAREHDRDREHRADRRALNVALTNRVTRGREDENR